MSPPAIQSIPEESDGQTIRNPWKLKADPLILYEITMNRYLSGHCGPIFGV